MSTAGFNVPCLECGRVDLPLHIDYRCPNCSKHQVDNPGRFYELTAEDVGKPTIRAFGQVWMAVDFIGRILPGDVGKRVFMREGILQVENDAQRAARVSP